ncbi:MAG: tetratricopeptide repeat protein [Candidatus Eisenbacteria bacterium]
MEKKSQDVTLRSAGLHVVVDMMSQVERVLVEELEMHPRFPDLHNRLALLRFKRQDFEGAKTCLDKALSIHAGYAAAMSSLGHCFLELGKDEKAESLFGRAYRAGRKVDALNDTAVLRMREGRYDDAGKLLREAASLEPRNGLLPHNTAIAFFLAGQPEEAASCLREAERLCPPYAEIFSEAVLFIGGKLSPEAYREYLTQQEMNPNLSELHDHLGHAYGANALFREAEEEYRLSLRTRPSLAAYYGNLALLHSAQDHEQEVLPCLLKAVDAEPDSVRARAALAFEYSTRGLASEATKQFEAAKELQPRYADIRYNLGLLYLEGGKHEAAISEFRAALDANRNYLFARNSLAFALFKKGSLAEALDEYRKVVASGLCSADILVNMGTILREKGALKKAIESFKKATRLNPDYGLAYYHLGVAYQAGGDREKARLAWKAYLERVQDETEIRKVKRAIEEA